MATLGSEYPSFKESGSKAKGILVSAGTPGSRPGLRLVGRCRCRGADSRSRAGSQHNLLCICSSAPRGGPLPGNPACRRAQLLCSSSNPENSRRPSRWRRSRSNSETWTLMRRVLNSQSQRHCCQRPWRPGTTPRRRWTTLSRKPAWAQPGPARPNPGVLYRPPLGWEEPGP